MSETLNIHYLTKNIRLILINIAEYHIMLEDHGKKVKTDSKLTSDIKFSRGSYKSLFENFFMLNSGFYGKNLSYITGYFKNR